VKGEIVMEGKDPTYVKRVEKVLCVLLAAFIVTAALFLSAGIGTGSAGGAPGAYASSCKTVVRLKTPRVSLTQKKNSNSVTLRWKKVKGAKCYRVYCKTGSGKYRKVATTGKTCYHRTIKSNCRFRVRAVGKKS
jgi:hypothetical protein